ncbi:hypothetical protein DPSP01_010531 [Paraphaeosphaeria sporulosa]
MIRRDWDTCGLSLHLDLWAQEAGIDKINARSLIADLVWHVPCMVKLCDAVVVTGIVLRFVVDNVGVIIGSGMWVDPVIRSTFITHPPVWYLMRESRRNHFLSKTKR